MDRLENDPQVLQEWFNMPIELQISNIGSKVLRADRWKKRGNYKNMRSFYNTAISFLRIAIKDPKNAARRNELELCVDELADYFIGENHWNTTSETLEKYYNAFLQVFQSLL